MDRCLFCAIFAGKVPAHVVYEDDMGARAFDESMWRDDIARKGGVRETPELCVTRA